MLYTSYESPEFYIHSHIDGDNTFPMSVNLMKLYHKRNLEQQMRIYTTDHHHEQGEWLKMLSGY